MRVRYVYAALGAIAATVLVLDSSHSGAAVSKTKLVPLVPRVDRSVFIQGRLQHSESLPPVESTLLPGRVMEAPPLVKLDKVNEWYQVPDWFAGTWRAESETCYYVYDYQVGSEDDSLDEFTSVSRETIGLQQDRLSGIWEYDYSPYISTSLGDGVERISYVKSRIPVSITEQKIVLKYISTNVVVSRYSQRILRVSQTESIQTYTPAAGRNDGFIKCDASIKSFDSAGKSIKLQHNVSGITRLKPFQPTAEYKGKALKPSFIAYLKSRRLYDRIPQ